MDSRSASGSAAGAAGGGGPHPFLLRHRPDFGPRLAPGPIPASDSGGPRVAGLCHSYIRCDLTGAATRLATHRAAGRATRSATPKEELTVSGRAPVLSPPLGGGGSALARSGQQHGTAVGGRTR